MFNHKIISHTPILLIVIAYVGNSAADFGETVRTTIFSEELRRYFCARKELELAFRS